MSNMLEDANQEADEQVVTPAAEATPEPTPEDELESFFSSLSEDEGFEDDSARVDAELSGTNELAVEDGVQPTNELPPEPKAQEDPAESEGIRSLRNAYKDQGKTLKELQAQIEEYRNAKPEPEAQRPDKVTQFAQEYSTEDMLTFLGRYESNTAEGDEQNLAQLRGQALEALERKPSAEIVEVLRKARAKGYGEVSRDVEAMAAEVLSTNNALSETNKTQREAQGRWQHERNSSMAEVLKVEGLADAKGQINPESEVGRSYLEHGEELLKLFPSITQNSMAPQYVLTYMQMKQKSTQYDAVASENKQLKARLAKMNGSMPSGSSFTEGSAPMTAEQELAASFSAQGFDV